MAVLEGMTSLKEVKASLEIAFAELDGISVATLAVFMKKTLRLSKRRVSSRNKRAFSGDRDHNIACLVDKLVEAKTKNIDVINVDEAAIVLGKTPTMKWAQIGESNIVVEEADSPQRYTLLLGVAKSGLVVGRLIEGSCTSFLFAEFIRQISLFYKDKEVIITADNAAIHKSLPVTEALLKSSIKLLLCPPYYPEGSPIELGFAFLKGAISRYSILSKEDLYKITSMLIFKMNSSYIDSIYQHCMNRALRDLGLV